MNVKLVNLHLIQQILKRLQPLTEIEMHFSPRVRPVIPRFGHNYVRFVLRSLVFTIPQSHVGEKTPCKNVEVHFTS